MRNFIPVAQAKAVEIISLIDRQPVEMKITSKQIRFGAKNKKVAYLGPEGTFSHKAMLNIFSKNAKPISCSTIGGVFEAVMDNKALLGVVPGENSTKGIIEETLENLIKYPLKVVGSYRLPIHLCLFGRTIDSKNIKIIKSHSQPIAQAKNWLNKNFPNVIFEIESSSAKAILSTKDPSVAFIGSAEAAKRYGLKILDRNIEDKKTNFTQFYIICKKDVPEFAKLLKPSRTLLILAVYDRPGVLRDILNHFADQKLNLTKLHSKKTEIEGWDYYFFLEIEALPENDKLKKAISGIKQYCSIVRILGIV